MLPLVILTKIPFGVPLSELWIIICIDRTIIGIYLLHYMHFGAILRPPCKLLLVMIKSSLCLPFCLAFLEFCMFLLLMFAIFVRLWYIGVHSCDFLKKIRTRLLNSIYLPNICKFRSLLFLLLVFWHALMLLLGNL